MSILAPYEFMERIKSLPFISSIYIYGSRARGENRLRSDIDIAVDCPHANDCDWQQILDIIDQADTLLPIDIIRWDTLPDGPLRQNILRDRKLVYRRESANENE